MEEGLCSEEQWTSGVREGKVVCRGKMAEQSVGCEAGCLRRLMGQCQHWCRMTLM